MKSSLLGIAIISTILLTGWTTSGAFLSANQTIVNLEQANYTITAINISDYAESGYVLAFSYST